MTSLPIPIPEGYILVVNKGDSVNEGDVIAKASDNSLAMNTLDLVGIYNEPASTVRKYLQKGPGDRVESGDIIASRSRQLGLKNDCIIANVSGTVIRFERDSGKLLIQIDNSEYQSERKDILSPLAGTIKVCNNDAVVILPTHPEETETQKTEKNNREESGISTNAGKMGIGGTATGQLLVISPEKADGKVESSDITKAAIGKILLLPGIDHEAVAKAAAVGVSGILATDITKELFVYVEKRKIDLPIISIDEVLGKSLIKVKEDITINGKEQKITYEN